MRKKAFSLISIWNQPGALQLVVILVIIKTDDVFDTAIDNQIGEDWPVVAVKWLPVVFGAHHLRRGNSQDMFASLVPVRDDMVRINRECRHRTAIEKFRNGRLLHTLNIFHDFPLVI